MHPGEFLREDVFPRLGMSRAELAKALKVRRSTLDQIMAGQRSVQHKVAHRLGTIAGYGPRFWLGMQRQHDLWISALARPDVPAATLLASRLN